MKQVNPTVSSTESGVCVAAEAGTPAPAPLPRINGYEIDSVIGEGGMGCVYRARQLSLDRTVAIKAIRGQYAGSVGFIRRLITEARLLARVGAHPNIAHVYDILNDRTGHYIVMEYIEGQSLQELMERRVRLSSNEIARIGYCTAKALATAHGQGVIHRDVKPANIMLCDDGLIKLMDFGVAFSVNDPATREERRGVGTPQYMAPEVAAGSGPENAQSDIYSLAVTLYVLVARRYPFPGHGRRGRPLSLRRHNPRVSPELDRIIFKGFAADPDERYRTAEEFAEALSQLFRESSDSVMIPLTRNLLETPSQGLEDDETEPHGVRQGGFLYGGARLAASIIFLLFTVAAAGGWAAAKSKDSFRAPETDIVAIAKPAAPAVLQPDVEETFAP